MAAQGETSLCVECWCLGMAILTALINYVTGSCLHFGDCPDPCQCRAHSAGPHEHTHFTIDCSQCQLTSLPAMLPQCIDPAVPMSYHLNFSRNNLAMLNLTGGELQNAYFRSTVDLDLSFNQLSTLSELLSLDLSRLRTLYLDNNQFTSLTQSELSNLTVLLPNLDTLTLHQNPWVCDCALEPLQDWLKTVCNQSSIDGKEGNYSIINDVNDVVCHRSNPSVPIIEADFQCSESKKKNKRREIPSYVTAIIVIVLLYLIICMCVAVCIVIRNRHKVKAEDDMQLK